ncbi:hypothetical protein D9V34_10940 [Mycetocola lacteus]|uniref:Asp23/Gls24 family envelope stress response protein n=1 Tax=Mycetocola lacteus TaxID=76637 RepID=A0A3L7AS88_9MICO|nr:hypothetical protein [Mycetocola lacteus]RLP82298.1 hypothetical protein D9V34_10940 [Mycetocola lacteus]
MSTVEDFELAAEIEATVRALPGVTGVFQAGLTVARVVEVGARLLGLRDGAATLVLLERESDTVRVSVAIGVDSAFGATETARRAHDAVGVALRARGEGAASIHVTVVHIEQVVAARSEPNEHPRDDSGILLGHPG